MYDTSLFQTAAETIGVILMWFNVFYYLRIWPNTNYLARLVIEVFREMRIFFVIYMIVHFAFAECFFFVSNASSQDYRETQTYFDSFRYSFLIALGNFNFSRFD